MRPRTDGATAPDATENRRRHESHRARAEQREVARATLLAERKRTVRTAGAPRSR
jgi:hypothetical protein